MLAPFRSLRDAREEAPGAPPQPPLRLSESPPRAPRPRRSSSTRRQRWWRAPNRSTMVRYPTRSRSCLTTTLPTWCAPRPPACCSPPLRSEIARLRDRETPRGRVETLCGTSRRRLRRRRTPSRPTGTPPLAKASADNLEDCITFHWRSGSTRA
eukprot:544716-Prorocentrum_minimum.AAC.1